MKNMLVIDGLSEQRSAFVFHVCEGLSIEEAGRKAGYPARHGYKVSKHPAVKAAIHERLQWLMQTQDAPVARLVLRSIMLDPKAPAGVRVMCADKLLNRAGHVEMKATAPETPLEQKSPSEMSGDELRQQIERMQSEMVKRAEGAQLIEGVSAPVSAPESGNLLDIFE